jgi:hypothetical protein
VYSLLAGMPSDSKRALQKGAVHKYAGTMRVDQ